MHVHALRTSQHTLPISSVGPAGRRALGARRRARGGGGRRAAVAGRPAAGDGRRALGDEGA